MGSTKHHLAVGGFPYRTDLLFHEKPSWKSKPLHFVLANDVAGRSIAEKYADDVPQNAACTCYIETKKNSDRVYPAKSIHCR